MIQSPERHITLTGSFNFRDLGGLIADTGKAVRTGKLFRADGLHALTDEDMEVLAGKRIATVIDLRTSGELEQTGPARLTQHGARHLHLSIMEGDVSSAESREWREDYTLGMMYGDMIANRGSQFAAVLQAIGEAGNLPAVFHCAAGKDRTGVTAAMIYGILGVSNDQIVADYALTNAAMEKMREAWASRGADTHSRNYPAHVMRADPENMEQFLELVEKRHGSMVGYLESIGVSDQTMQSIRDQML